MEYSNFAEFLTDKRAMSGLTVRCLAGKIGCPASLITEVEKDKKNPPRYEKLIKLARALKLSPEETHLMFDLAGRKGQSCSGFGSLYTGQRECCGWDSRCS